MVIRTRIFSRIDGFSFEKSLNIYTLESGRFEHRILGLCLILLILFNSPGYISAQDNSSGLIIHPDNPYFMFYKGRLIVSWHNGKYVSSHHWLKAGGITHYPVGPGWKDGRAEALAGNRFPSDKNINFNDQYFSEFKSRLNDAANNGVAVSIVLFSLTGFEADRTPGSRFGQNPWNACLGGPISIGSCPYQKSGEHSPGATKQFLTLEHYDYNNPLIDQYSTYSSSWSTPRKVQYRLEEIIKKFVEEFRNYDNWYFNMMWETNDNPDAQLTKKWVKWFSGFSHRLDPNRLVFTGEEAGTEYANSASSVDGSFHEGNVLGGSVSDSIKKLGNLGSIANGKPKVIVGYDPFDSNGQRRDHIYNTTPELYSTKQNVKYMRAALLAGKGVHPGTAFHSAYYDMSGTFSWLKALQDFLETVDSWHNEPGDEITDATMPTHNDFSFIDLPDGDGRKGWPRYGNGNRTDNTPPDAPKGIKVVKNNEQ